MDQGIDIVSTLSQAGFGEHAANIERQGYKPETKDGVTVYSGDDKGVPFRFFVHTPIREAESAQRGYKVADEMDAIEWLTNKTSHPTAIIRAGHLPSELLDFEEWKVPKEFHPEHGYQINTKEYHDELRKLKPVGGLLFDAYTRWKEGREAKGTLLSKWDGLGEGDLATFQANGIMTLEQLASHPPERTRRWSAHMLELQQAAVLELNEQEHMKKAREEVAKLGDLKALLAKQAAEIEKLKAAQKPKAKTSSRKKTDSETKGEE